MPWRRAKPDPKRAAAGSTSGSRHTASKPHAPQAPFVLTKSQQELLDQILLKWEKQSDKVRTFTCNFTRWEVRSDLGAKGKPIPEVDGHRLHPLSRARPGGILRE